MPALDAVVLARLQLDNVRVRSGFELWVLIEALLCILVERLQVTDLRWIVQKVREVQVKLSDGHTELGAPITDMIDTVHFVAEEFEDATCAVTLDGRSQMANVHILCDVRRREVYKDTLFPRGLF